MKTLILFSSKYGGTEKCAHLLSEKLNGDVNVINLKENKNITLSDYDKIIVGSSIYVGNVQADIKDFCSNNSDSLIAKPFGLFLSCMADSKEEIKSYAQKSFSNELINHATIVDSLGGVFNFEKMNFFERQIIKMILKSKNKNGELDIKIDGKANVSTILNKKVLKFANAMNS